MKRILLKVIVCVVVALTYAFLQNVSISMLGIEISGSIGARIVQQAIEMLLSWGLLLISLKLSGAKVTISYEKEVEKMKYAGWINATPKDVERLKELGVCGAMIYNKGAGALEYCEIPDIETMDRLEEEFPGFQRGSFTVVKDCWPDCEEKDEITDTISC